MVFYVEELREKWEICDKFLKEKEKDILCNLRVIKDKTFGYCDISNF